jgi:hypothetical protein
LNSDKNCIAKLCLDTELNSLEEVYMASPSALYRFIYKDKLVLWLLYLPAGNFFKILTMEIVWNVVENSVEIQFSLEIVWIYTIWI